MDFSLVFCAKIEKIAAKYFLYIICIIIVCSRGFFYSSCGVRPNVSPKDRKSLGFSSFFYSFSKETPQQSGVGKKFSP
jgi:hypothetical protein